MMYTHERIRFSLDMKDVYTDMEGFSHILDRNKYKRHTMYRDERLVYYIDILISLHMMYTHKRIIFSLDMKDLYTDMEGSSRVWARSQYKRHMKYRDERLLTAFPHGTLSPSGATS